MGVNFNNLRTQASYAYNRLTVKLNDAMNQDYNEGHILISPDEIKGDMQDLKQALVAICCVFEPGDKDFADVSKEVEENGGWETLNKTTG